MKVKSELRRKRSDLKRTLKAMEGSLTTEMVASINKELKNVEMELAKK